MSELGGRHTARAPQRGGIPFCGPLVATAVGCGWMCVGGECRSRTVSAVLCSHARALARGMPFHRAPSRSAFIRAFASSFPATRACGRKRASSLCPVRCVFLSIGFLGILLCFFAQRPCPLPPHPSLLSLCSILPSIRPRSGPDPGLNPPPIRASIRGSIQRSYPECSILQRRGSRSA